MHQLRDIKRRKTLEKSISEAAKDDCDFAKQEIAI